MSTPAAMPILHGDARSLSKKRLPAESSRAAQMRGPSCSGRKRNVDLLVRGAGVALVMLAYVAVLGLVQSPTLRNQSGPSWLDAALAAISFLSASFGMAAVCLGGHLLDRVPVSDRWRRRDVPRSRMFPTQAVEDSRLHSDANTPDGW